MPDKVFGERICAYVALKEGASLSFQELVAHLKGIGASVMQLPERLEIIDAIPSPGRQGGQESLKEDITGKLAQS